MMPSSNRNIFRVTGHLCGEFTGHRWIPHRKASDAKLWCFFDLRINKWLSKRWWCRWFETPSRPLCNHSNAISALAIELLQFCTKPSISYINDIYIYIYWHRVIPACVRCVHVPHYAVDIQVCLAWQELTMELHMITSNLGACFTLLAGW